MSASSVNPTPTWEQDQTLGSDAVLLYNVQPWSKLGFGVPNFADRLYTQNKAWISIARRINQCQFHVMTHVDARREHYPSVNTVLRLCDMLNQAKTAFKNRAVAASEARLEGGHVSPAASAWLISPVPYFNNIVRNQDLKDLNELVMFALANIYQSSDNNLPLTITVEAAQLVWSFLNECVKLIGTRWLDIPRADLVKEDFSFDLTKVRQAYSPPSNPGAEASIVPLGSTGLFTETNLQSLYQGLEAPVLYPLLARFPATAVDGSAQTARGIPVSDAVSRSVPSAVAPL